MINDAFERSGKELVKANVTAKMIKDALDPYREDFRDGTCGSGSYRSLKVNTSIGSL